MSFTITPEKDEMYIILPIDYADGEPGDPIDLRLQSILWILAGHGWWPVDFGEADDEHVVLWLKRDEPAVARMQTHHFIERGGDV